MPYAYYAVKKPKALTHEAGTYAVTVLCCDGLCRLYLHAELTNCMVSNRDTFRQLASIT